MSIELKNVTYTYSPGTSYEIHALKDINLEIPQSGKISTAVLGTTSNKTDAAIIIIEDA